MDAPRAFSLEEPEAALRWFSSGPRELRLDEVKLAEIWGLAGMAALARRESEHALVVGPEGSVDPTSRFAHAVGLFDVIEGREAAAAAEPGRTVELTRIRDFQRMDSRARQIAELLIGSSEHEDTARTIQYVLIELWRNVIQHSADPLGGIVAAQLNDRGRHASRPTVQVAVADAGVGIQSSLKRSHPGMADPQAAIQRALEPHISGTFEEGETGSLENAGMGLFFIAEMTKLVAGTLLVASRGAAFSLAGDPLFEGHHRVSALPRGVEFPGTLVAFEMPAFEQQDYTAMIETIRERARERLPRRVTHKWLVYGSTPESARTFLVRLAAEDTQAAQHLAETQLKPLLVSKTPVTLNFLGIHVLTQSFVHSLLFEPLRIAWALKVKIHVVNAEPAVLATLQLLESYALSG